MVTASELNGCGDDLFEALALCRVLSKLVDNLMEHFGALIQKIGIDKLLEGFPSADQETGFVDFEIFGNGRWKFHF